MDLLFVLLNFFLLGVTVEAPGANIDWKLAF